MTNFEIHDTQSAPAKSVASLEAARKAYGFIPNLIGTLAESPAAVKAYLTLDQLLAESSLSAVERNIATLAISRYNECHYCMAAVSAVAEMQKVPAEAIEAIRNDRPIPDGKLEALRSFATKVVDKRGWVTDDDISEFLSAGYAKASLLDVIVAASYKTLSNYANHISGTPVDQVFESRKWTAPDKSEAA